MSRRFGGGLAGGFVGGDGVLRVVFVLGVVEVFVYFPQPAVGDLFYGCGTAVISLGLALAAGVGFFWKERRGSRWSYVAAGVLAVAAPILVYYAGLSLPVMSYAFRAGDAVRSAQRVSIVGGDMHPRAAGGEIRGQCGTGSGSGEPAAIYGSFLGVAELAPAGRAGYEPPHILLLQGGGLSEYHYGVMIGAAGFEPTHKHLHYFRWADGVYFFSQ